MKSAVTISLVPEARDGPFVFWDDLDAACASARQLGFDAVEIFPPSAEHLEEIDFAATLERHGLKLAALGTGAGWVKHQFTLSSPDVAVRARALEFAHKIVKAGAALGAPAIIGSMQGRWTDAADADRAIGHLVSGLQFLSFQAHHANVRLLYEPLNRYETTFCRTLEAGVEFVKAVNPETVRLLADLFHMNIEEQDLAGAIRNVGKHIGHVHLADSNRRPAGSGHTDFAPIAQALRDVGYGGYVSAECLPYPDSDAAARATIDAFNRHFR